MHRILVGEEGITLVVKKLRSDSTRQPRGLMFHLAKAGPKRDIGAMLQQGGHEVVRGPVGQVAEVGHRTVLAVRKAACLHSYFLVAAQIEVKGDYSYSKV
jgi:hypothetical protein